MNLARSANNYSDAPFENLLNSQTAKPFTLERAENPEFKGAVLGRHLLPSLRNVARPSLILRPREHNGPDAA